MMSLYNSRDCMPNCIVVAVFLAYLPVTVFHMNLAIQRIFAHSKVGRINSGASFVNIHLMPLYTLPHVVQTSLLLTLTCPPLAKLVRIAG